MPLSLLDYLKPGDVLVRNNTKVIPARLFGIKEETNGHVEVLLLKELKKDTWECLCGNARIVKMNTVITFGEGLLKAKCIEIKDEGIRVFKLIYDGILYEILDKNTSNKKGYFKNIIKKQAKDYFMNATQNIPKIK